VASDAEESWWTEEVDHWARRATRRLLAELGAHGPPDLATARRWAERSGGPYRSAYSGLADALEAGEALGPAVIRWTRNGDGQAVVSTLPSGDERGVSVGRRVGGGWEWWSWGYGAHPGELHEAATLLDAMDAAEAWLAAQGIGRRWFEVDPDHAYPRARASSSFGVDHG